MPITDFEHGDIMAVDPGAGRATLRLDTTQDLNHNLLLTGRGLVLARGGSLSINGGRLEATGIRRDVLEGWAEAE